MRGTSSGGFVPSCSYYDEEAGRWDSAGLAIEAAEEEVVSAGEVRGDSVNGVNLTCQSFHLSDFTLSTEEVDAAFRTVPLVSCAGDRCHPQTQFVTYFC